MLDTQEFGDFLQSVGLSDFVGVPCSYLSPLINYAINERCFIMSNNEGDAVAIASGISLVRNRHSVLSDFSGSASDASLRRMSNTPHSLTSHNPKNSSQALECQESLCNKSLDSETSESNVNSHASESSTQANAPTQGNSKILNESANNGAAGFLGDFKGCQGGGEGVTLKVMTEADNADSLKSGKKPTRYGVVLMQNSGLSNALSPLTSLNHTFEIPILGFVSLRGERDSNGKNTDEPQHELLGIITDKLLETCQIHYAFLDSDMQRAKEQVQEALKILGENKSFFFVVRDKTFSKVKLENNPIQITDSQKDISATPQYDKASKSTLPTRLEALTILHTLALKSQTLLLATTGKCGRELYEIADTPNQLYMVGSMGCVSSLALGISLKTNQKVIAIDGDSALLMRLGALSTNAYYANTHNKGNFCHVLLDNESHDSTGGQFNLSPFVEFSAIAKHCGYANVYEARSLEEFEEYVKVFLDSEKSSSHFIYLKIAKGSKDNLGRPKITPKEVARRLENYINSHNEDSPKKPRKQLQGE